ncbi:MAG: AglZ/HisF2 family acetamidino modification protein [Methanomassiliicoccales archaeon]
MIKTRVIPCLLLKGKGCVKTEKFSNPRYLGDPINIVRIFNEKEAHEIAILDITATSESKGPNFDYLKNIASEAFMPMSYGGGIRNIEDCRKILKIGFEKVILNYAAVANPQLVKEASDEFGSQSVIVSIDAKKSISGRYEVMIINGKIGIKKDPSTHARNMESLGAGELIVTSIDKEGTMSGYDIELIRKVTEVVDIPVLANGGAGNLKHFELAVKEGGASGVIASSFFVFHGKNRGILINFPEENELKKYLV